MKHHHGLAPYALVVTATVARVALLVGVLWATSQSVAAVVEPPLTNSYKMISPQQILPGRTTELAYQIVLTNTSSVADTDVMVIDALPPEISYVPLSAYALPEGQGITWLLSPDKQTITFTVPTVPGITAGQPITLGFSAEVDGASLTPGSVVTNTAVISDATAVLSRSAVVTVSDYHLVYFPLIMRRWPPVPYPPVLTLESNDGRGNYTLSWTYPYTDLIPSSYELQEDDDPNFVNAPSPVAATSPKTFTDKPVGTYYYRVRGVNSYGPGEWSNVVVVEHSGYYDDFSDAGSGWPRKVYKEGDRSVFDVSYENGSYRAKIMLNTQGLNNYRMGRVKAPWSNPYNAYVVEVNHRFARAEDQLADPTGGKAGLIFGAKSDFSTIFVLEWNFEGNCAVTKYKNIGGDVIDVRGVLGSATYYKYWGSCAAHGWYADTPQNFAKVEVNGNRATVYINGQKLTTFTDSDLGGMHQVGLISGSWERTPVENRFDEFSVTPQ